MSRREGGCQCGAVRFVCDAEPELVAMCHCHMCRRAHAAPSVAWAMFRDSTVQISGAMRRYASSPEAQRHFCAQCGTPLAFTASFLPGLIDLAVGAFDAPETLPPQLHYWQDSALSWCRHADDLPRFAQLPPQEG